MRAVVSRPARSVAPTARPVAPRRAASSAAPSSGPRKSTVNVLYTTSATANGGRDGRSRTTDGAFEVKLATPKELGGAGGQGNNPEQLFAAGYAACFLGAMKAVASKGGHVRIPNEATVTSTVGIGPRAEGGFGLTVALKVAMPGVERGAAEKLVAAAHEVCPYSNATRGNIDVKLSVA